MTGFTNKRGITSADQLTPHQTEQLRACGYASYTVEVTILTPAARPGR